MFAERIVNNGIRQITGRNIGEPFDRVQVEHCDCRVVTIRHEAMFELWCECDSVSSLSVRKRSNWLACVEVQDLHLRFVSDEQSAARIFDRAEVPGPFT